MSLQSTANLYNSCYCEGVWALALELGWLLWCIITNTERAQGTSSIMQYGELGVFNCGFPPSTHTHTHTVCSDPLARRLRAGCCPWSDLWLKCIVPPAPCRMREIPVRSGCHDLQLRGYFCVRWLMNITWIFVLVSKWRISQALFYRQLWALRLPFGRGWRPALVVGRLCNYCRWKNCEGKYLPFGDKSCWISIFTF